MKRKIWFGLAAVLTLAVLGSQMLVYDVAAEDAVVIEGCGLTETSSYSGSISPAPDTYDVYVKLGKPGQTAAVSGHVYSFDGSTACASVGSLEASGDEWRKLGVYSDVNTEGETIFQLSSPVLSNLPDANRPSLLLISQTSPACLPKLECETSINGEMAYIRPSSNSLGQNSLRIVIARDLKQDSVKRVLYYVDNNFMYETKSLQPFDMRSVPYYGHAMTRVVEYESGQTAVLQADVPDDHVDSLPAMIFRLAKRYQNTLILMAVLVGIIVVVRTIRAIVAYGRHRWQWMISHGFVKDEADQPLTEERLRTLRRQQLLSKIYDVGETIVFVGVIIVGIVTIGSIYVGQIASVNGESMVASYQNGQQVFVNKLPVTLASINNSSFIPKRGEVVVAYPGYGASVDAAEAKDEMIIKRVIGLPGEKIVINDGVIIVFNSQYPEGFRPEEGTTWATNVQKDDALDQITIQLNENELFLVGDNRPASIDSRYNGPISADQLIGVVL